MATFAAGRLPHLAPLDKYFFPKKSNMSETRTIKALLELLACLETLKQNLKIEITHNQQEQKLMNV